MKDIIIDGHNDTMMHLVHEETWLPKGHIGERNSLHIDLEKLKTGGLNIPIFAAFTEGYYKNNAKSLSRTLALLNALYYSEKMNREDFKIVRDLKEIERIIKQGKIGGIPAIEGAYFFTEDNYSEILAQFRDLGVRILAFNWNYSNLLGEGAAEEYEENGKKSQGGITDLGIRALKEMKKLGIGIDVSHMNERTFWGVAKDVENPIIATHSNAYSLTPHRRNLTDEQLREIARSGGLVGAVLCPTFLTNNEKAYLEDYLDHIDYMVKLIGVDHVGIGSDFDGADLPVDIEDSSEIFKIKRGLVERGYSETDIEKILGGNFLRVLEEIDRKSQKDDSFNISIQTNIKMGDCLPADGILKVNLSDRGNIRIILDGKELIFLKEQLNVEYKIELDNREIFHILTVEVKNGENKIKRETNIINI